MTASVCGATATRRGFLATTGAIILLGSIPGAAQTAGPDGFIHDLGQRTVTILKDPALDRSAKLNRLVPLLQEATDMPLVARLVLGRYWRDANDAQRGQYVELFKALVIKTMADRLNTYGGQTFIVAGTRAADERDTVVATRIEQPGGPPFNVEWRVRVTNGRFAIVDIVAEGISMVVTQRSEVGEIVARQGIDGLLQTMRQRLQQPA